MRHPRPSDTGVSIIGMSGALVHFGVPFLATEFGL